MTELNSNNKNQAINYKRRIHLITVILFFFLSPVYSKPAVHWQERAAVIYIRRDNTGHILNKYKFSEEESIPVHSNSGGNYYRISTDLFKKMETSSRTLISSPPFSWVESGIVQRRKSSDFATLWNGYKDVIITEKILFELSRRYPGITDLRTIGKSLQGRPIYALKISKNPRIKENEPSFLFSSALHGNEPISIDYVLDMARTVLENTETKKDPTLLRSVDEAALWFVPIINPDGVNIFWNINSLEGRKNARDTFGSAGWNPGEGVDLNRNYPFFWNSGHREASSGNPKSVFYRGKSAASEPEVQTMMNLARQENFVMAFTFHTFATKILTPYTIEGASNPYPNNAFRIAERLAKKGKSYRKNKDYTADKNLYPVDGTDQDWFYNSFGTFAFTVEGSYQTPEYETAQKSIRGMLPVSREMLEIYFKGPTLTVNTADISGRPIEADVSIAEIANISGETIRTEKNFGRFDFILLDADTYTLIAEKKGFQKYSKKIKCRKGLQRISIKMVPLIKR